MVRRRVMIAAVEERMPGDSFARCVPNRTACAAEPESLMCVHWSQLRTASLDARRAVGPTYPRHVLSRMYRGEAYVLQIDAHMHFVRGWDEELLRQWHLTGNENAVISAYPTDVQGSLTADLRSARTSRPIMCKTAFADETNYGVIIHGRQPEGRPVDGEPNLEPFWAAGFSFARGHWAVRVPYDPLLPMIFQGDETDLHGSRKTPDPK